MSFDGSNNLSLPNSITDQTPRAPTSYIPSVTTSSMGALAGITTMDASGAVTFGSTLAVTGTTTLGAATINALTVTTTSTLSGAVTCSSTLGVVGNFAINTNKFNVTASSGNTTIAGTLGVTGLTTLGSWKGTADLGGAVVALTPSGTVALDSTLGNVFTLTPGEDETINVATVPATAQEIHIRVLTSGTTSRTLTFGTNFKSTGTLATGTTTAKTFIVKFISDGTNFNEVSRTTAM
jgi:hypothetical protein